MNQNCLPMLVRLRAGSPVFQDTRWYRWPLDNSAVPYLTFAVDTVFERRPIPGSKHVDLIANGFGDLTRRGDYGSGSLCVDPSDTIPVDVRDGMGQHILWSEMP